MGRGTYISTLNQPDMSITTEAVQGDVSWSYTPIGAGIVVRDVVLQVTRN